VRDPHPNKRGKDGHIGGDMHAAGAEKKAHLEERGEKAFSLLKEKGRVLAGGKCPH